MKKLETVVKQYSHSIDEGMNQLASVMSELLAEEEAKKPHPLLSKKAQKNRFEKEFSQEFHTLKKRLESGASHIIHKMIALSHSDPEMFSEEVATDMTKLITLTTSLVTQQAEFVEQLSQNKSLIDIARVGSTTFEKMYQAAKAIYSEKQFLEAADAFGFLTILSSQNYSCWLGLAHSEFFSHRYDQALYAYAFCSQLNPNDPTCHIYSSRCYVETKELDNAINAIDLALIVIDHQDKYKDLKPKLEREKQRLIAKRI